MLALFIMNFIKQLFWKKEEDYGRGEYSEGSARFEEESSEEEELVKPEKKNARTKTRKTKIGLSKKTFKAIYASTGRRREFAKFVRL